MFNEDDIDDSDQGDPGFGFFMSADHQVLNDEEQLEGVDEDVTEYDDDKNDLTFGDDPSDVKLQSSLDQWQEMSMRTSEIDSKDRNTFFPSPGRHKESNDFFSLPREAQQPQHINTAPPPNAMPTPSQLLQHMKKDTQPLGYGTSPQLGNAIWSPPKDYSPNTPGGQLTPPSFFAPRTQNQMIGTQPIGIPQHPYGSPHMHQQQPGNYFSVDDIESQFVGMQIKSPPHHQPQPMPMGTPPQPFSMPYPQPTRETPPPATDQKEGAPYRKYLYYTYNTYNPKQIDATYNQINRRLFNDSEFMNAEEIEVIVRQQMADLQIHNPFLDDYYYCSTTNKKSINQKRINSNFANWVVESLAIYKTEEELEAERQKEKEELAQLPRVFGRIPSQNVRAPRTIFEFDKEVREQMLQVSSHSTLNRDANVNLNVMLENGMNIVMQIQEHALCQRQTSSNYGTNQKLKEDFFGLCNSVTTSIIGDNGSRLFTILCKRKGIKYISKALRHMPDIFTGPILSLIFLNWRTVFNDELWVQYEQELRVQFADAVAEALSAFNSIDGLCQLLLRISPPHANDPSQTPQTELIDFTKAFQTDEGSRIFSALLNRVFDLRKRNKALNANTWLMIYEHLFERTRGNFTAIVTKSVMGWELATAFLRHCNNIQKPLLIQELRQFLSRNDIDAMKSFYAVLTQG